MVRKLYKGETEMKAQVTILLCLLAISLAGCSTMRQVAIDTSVENMKNAETIREVSKNCLSTWSVQSGFIKGVLGSRINELPKETIEAMDELDRLAGLSEQSDYELGLFLGMKVRLLNSVVQAAIEKYAPEIVEYLTLVL